MRILLGLSFGLLVILMCSGFDIRIQDDEKSVNCVYIAEHIKIKYEGPNKEGLTEVLFSISETVWKPAGYMYRQEHKDSTFIISLGVLTDERINIRKGDTLELTLDSEKIILRCKEFMGPPSNNGYRQFGRRPIIVYSESPMYDVKREVILKLAAAKRASFVVKGGEFSIEFKIPKDGIAEVREFCDKYVK